MDFPPISHIKYLWSNDVFKKNDYFKAYRLSQIPFLTFTWPSPALPWKSPAAKPACGTENAPGARFASSVCSECKLDKCTSLFGPKRGQKKRRLFLTICFFYTVNFVSFACCDFNCLKRQKKGVKKAHLIRNNVFVMWTILPNMRACVCFNLCVRLGAWLCDFIWALDQL